MVFQQIDYMKFKSTKPMLPIEQVQPASGNFKWRSTTALGTILWGHNKSEKFSHVLSGIHCNEYRSRGIEDIQALDSLLSDGAEFTRLDLAITVNGNYMEQAVSYSQSARGALRDAGIKMIENGETRQYETLYIGNQKKRATRGIFRAYRYDIAHGLDIDLTRFELECGSRTAHASAKRIVKGTSIGAQIKYYLDFPQWEQWQAWTSGDVHEHFRGKSASMEDTEKYQSRLNWLIEQVAPSLAELMVDSTIKHGNHAPYHEFIKAVKRHYDDKLQSAVIDL